jgi:hypothetical protein
MLYCYPLVVSLLTSHHGTNIGTSYFMRRSGYHCLSTPEALDNFSDARSFPIHEQVGPENPDG